eukprot:s1035_g8.t1
MKCPPAMLRHTWRLSAVVPLLESLPAMCRSPAMAAAWQGVQTSLGAASTLSQTEDALALLVAQALAAEELSLARQLCLRMVALKEDSESGGSAELLPPAVLHALVCAHARAGDADVAFSLLGILEKTEKHQALPVEIFEALVEGLVSSGRCRSAFGAFERMKTWAMVKPTRALYVQMIKASGMVRDPDQAQSLFDEMMSKHGTDHNDEAQLELIIALTSRRRTTRAAFRMANEVLARGHPALSWRLCVGLARGCAELGEAEEAKRLRRRMLAAGIIPDDGVRSDIVRAFGRAAAMAPEADRGKLLSHAWREVQEARGARGQALSHELLHAILSAYSSCGLPWHADEILTMSHDELGVEADATAYQLVLTAYFTASPSDPRFVRLWRRMLRAETVKPTEEALQMALKVAVTLQDRDFTKSVLELMFESRCAPDPSMLQQLQQLSTNAPLRRLLGAFGGLRKSLDGFGAIRLERLGRSAMKHWEGVPPETCVSLAAGEAEAAAVAAQLRRQLEAIPGEKRKGSFATGILCPDCQEEPPADGKLLSLGILESIMVKATPKAGASTSDTIDAQNDTEELFPFSLEDGLPGLPVSAMPLKIWVWMFMVLALG